MTTPENTDREHQIGRAVRFAAALLFGGVALLVVLIAGGMFDPRPFGSLLRHDRPGVHALPAASERAIPQSPPWLPDAPPRRFSVRLTAALTGGDVDSGYGLALTDGAEQLLIAVSPTGAVVVREADGSAPPTYHLPWQPWPHVRPGTAENEIRLDVTRTDAGAEVTAWVNRERLWHGATDWTPSDVALWLGSFDGPASVEFRALDWFSA